MRPPQVLGIIAGNGVYPRVLAGAAGKAGVKKIVATAFTGETRPVLTEPSRLIASIRGRHVDCAWQITKEPARLEIGQTDTVKPGPAVAVEAFEGTNEAIRRGGALPREGAGTLQVAKPNQDMRFGAPVIGVETIRVAAEAKLRVIAVEAGKTLLLEPKAIDDLAAHSKLSIIAR